MKIEAIDIKYFSYSDFTTSFKDKSPVHIKQLPCMSIVQSTIGKYGISINGGKEYKTEQGGFFIAPSIVTQKITHYPLENETEEFSARCFFIDAVINNKYHFDDCFDFPVIADDSSALSFSRLFDEYEQSDCVCDRMSCVYKILKQLIKISTEKARYRNKDVYPVTEFLKENYTRHISIKEMAEIMKTSESNLYAVFKGATGVSPLKFLNDYRLSVACDLLLQTDDSIKTIAEKVGIPDQFYFSKLFKARYLTSPMQYRIKK